MTYVNSGESSAGKRMFGVVPRNRDIGSLADIVLRELGLGEREAEEGLGGREGGGVIAGRERDGGLR